MTDTGLSSSARREQGLICPACRVDLVMTDRQGIEIDYCPKCRGVWLDRGELDKIIERSAAYEAGSPLPQAAPEPPTTTPGYGRPWDGGRSAEHGGGHGWSKHGGGGHGGRRRGFLGDLFD
ncbi:MAG: recombination protein RecR [Phenylobacterium sp.]|uniref:TFIIB-type zinc ribbon-containing protein n=1 Tax=Phenylobacterium sp. TaxID=1871053 RepID=UPI0012034BC2|nr:zf-TFIIB domain-containing protein [Phenylobacterium sp.]TAL36246.1 MAG: recombination protein RecR [Phenylobacterium sp.]